MRADCLIKMTRYSDAVKTQRECVRLAPHIRHFWTNLAYSEKRLQQIAIETRLRQMNAYVRGSWRMGTPFNDIIPRNMGVNGQIFDPSIDWVTGTAVVGGGGILTWGAADLLDARRKKCKNTTTISLLHWSFL
jgi:hypothetical protein